MIGLAGCGRMGLPMLAALHDGGVDAMGFDLVDPGLPHVTTNIMGFAPRLETLFSVVRDEAQTNALLFDSQNLMGTAPNLNRIFICSTLSPRYVRGLRDRIPDHITLIDAPMSGAVIAAENRTLSFMLGGNDQDIADATPMLALMGTNFHHMGGFGAGMQAKVLNNLLAASHTAMTRLVLDWADEAGLDTNHLLNLIETSSGQNWLASGFETIEFAKHGYAPDNSIGILVKDVSAALDAAPDGADTSLPKQVQATIRALKPRTS
ncbi:NAD(P)-dependent oxidoreductase [Tateyamaria omphalii]|uniref:3-hydroxyisobutyrate dehydrogenase n=1 Tax=Tateyamaria omphalii TaxID=299262 RepID=A0A1P8MVW8_9RHOB|nr:NAD(P)-binding domain-containing protein [Tateyamaria omphalii]APX12089.1 3-hydroxyisobutyrate dehydrogenase [Tateyamaria omphalii]